jgi:hypothetical protein
MTSESCPHCGFPVRKQRPDGRCVSCGKKILPETAPKAVPTIVALKQGDNPTETEMEKDVRAFLVHKVAEGFDDESNIIGEAVTLFVTGEPLVGVYSEFRTRATYRKKDVQRAAERIAAELLETQRRLEGQWAGPTDCDQLDRAFDELNRHGIIARQNLPCCNTCGLAEISADMEAKIRNGETVRGYVFYHQQDTEVAPHGELFLSYGSHGDSPEDTVCLGQEIVQELARVGLTAAWTNKPDERIAVPLTWRKRRFSRLP